MGCIAIWYARLGETLGWPVALGVLGAVLGSFLATLVVRWPAGRGMDGRSACDGCGRTLTAVELVPLVSAAVQRWRCRSCGAAIDPRHGLIEAGCVLIGVTAGIAATGPAAIAGAVFGWLLLTLAALDVAALWLPDRLTGGLAVAGVAAGLGGVWPAMAERLIGGAAGFGALWLVAALYRRLRGRSGMGGGDPKLFGAIGLWLGWRMLPAVLLLASLIGLALVLLARVRGQAVERETPMPFGALLAVAAYPAWLVMIGAAG